MYKFSKFITIHNPIILPRAIKCDVLVYKIFNKFGGRGILNHYTLKS